MMKRRAMFSMTLLVILLLLVNVYFPVLFSSTDGLYSERSSQLSIYSDDWNGLSKFREELEDPENGDYEVSTIISNPLILREVIATGHPEYSLYICIGAEKGYDKLQVDAIIDFVNAGGRVLIADDSGDAQSFSKKLGVEFTGHRIWSQEFVHNLSFIQIEAKVEFETYSVLLNTPTTLKILGTTDKHFDAPEVLFQTSRNSYEDSNDNGKIDSIGELDTYGELPVGVFVDSKGKGSVYFISDSSFCINDMWGPNDEWGTEGNAPFVMALVQDILGFSGTVIFDESRHIQSTPLSNSIFNLENIYVYVLLQTDQLLGLIIALAFLNFFGLMYALTKPPIRFRHRFDLTYWYAYVEQAPDRLTDVRTILLKRMKAHFNLYFPDSSSLYAYEPATKAKYNLTSKSDLKELIEDMELVDFMLHPYKYNMADRLNHIVLRIDEVFPLQEGMS
jgi:hypothetical protein